MLFLVFLPGCYTLIVFCYHVTVSILCNFVKVLWDCIQCMIVDSPVHSHLLFSERNMNSYCAAWVFCIKCLCALVL